MRDAATIGSVTARKIRVLVVDHNPLVREGLSLLIQLQPDMEIAHVATSAEEAVNNFTQNKPDVTLMDLDLPLGAGVKAIQQILGIEPTACVVGLLTYEWDQSRIQALRLGARSCLTKDRLNEDLISILRGCSRLDV